MKAKKIKSALTAVRRALKLKGKSWHTGRGYYECYIAEDITWDELLDRLLGLYAKLPLTELECDGDSVNFTVKMPPEFKINGVEFAMYNSFRFSRSLTDKSNWLGRSYFTCS